MANSVCNRCPAYAKCLLDYGSKACYRLADSYGFNARPTQFDRIKDMSIDELADLLARRKFSCMSFCKQCDACNQHTFCYPFCVQGIKKWLESEVQSDD